MFEGVMPIVPATGIYGFCQLDDGAVLNRVALCVQATSPGFRSSYAPGGTLDIFIGKPAISSGLVFRIIGGATYGNSNSVLNGGAGFTGDPPTNWTRAVQPPVHRQ